MRSFYIKRIKKKIVKAIYLIKLKPSVFAKILCHLLVTSNIKIMIYVFLRINNEIDFLGIEEIYTNGIR